MRLWHYSLIKEGLLPDSQLLVQWKELNSIFKKQDKHILINYVYEYDKDDLESYSYLVLNEMYKRGIKVNNYNNLYSYFGYNLLDHQAGVNILFRINHPELVTQLFPNHHTNQYLLICFMNLYEKKLRKQKDFTDECFNKMYDYVNQYFDLKGLGVNKV